MFQRDVPELVPVLSRGKHRSPRKGACFMELASFLAGERWSDHPACTHPLLAGVARLVNDYTSDAGRPQLASMIPSVIGLAGDDLRIDARIALQCARMALPVAAADRQRVLAVSVLASERMLAELDGRDVGAMSDESRRALEDVPHAAAWATRFAAGTRGSEKSFRRYGAPSAVRYAIQGIAYACIADPDRMLRDVLAVVIDDCARLTATGGHMVPDVDAAAWDAAYRLTVKSQ